MERFIEIKYAESDDFDIYYCNNNEKIPVSLGYISKELPDIDYLVGSNLFNFLLYKFNTKNFRILVKNENGAYYNYRSNFEYNSTRITQIADFDIILRDKDYTDYRKQVNILPVLSEGKNICLSLSGGLDSTILLHLLVQKYGNKRVKCISFNYGQRHLKELEYAKYNTYFLNVEHKVIDVTYMSDLVSDVCSLVSDSSLKPIDAEISKNIEGNKVNTYVPYRNLQFIAITACYAEAHNCEYIALSTNRADLYGYWDTSKDFTDAVNNVLKLNNHNNLKLITPFVDFHKDDETKIALDLEHKTNYDILGNNWSCYNGLDKECGKCNTCNEKLKGFIKAKVPDQRILNIFDIKLDELNSLKEKYANIS